MMSTMQNQNKRDSTKMNKYTFFRKAEPKSVG